MALMVYKTPVLSVAYTCGFPYAVFPGPTSPTHQVPEVLGL